MSTTITPSSLPKLANKLQGKVALVTGASRGLGVALAQALADQGANVAITYAASAAKADAVVASLREKGVKALAIQTDQADATQAEPVIQKVLKEFGSLDILVNNAAVAVQGQPVGSPDRDYTALDRMWDINVHGVVAYIRAAAKVLSDGGRIITIGSAITARVGFAGAADYAATKSAITGYSKGVARDLGSRNITVNVIQAGLMDTDMAAEAGVAASLFPSLAIQRFGALEEVAAVATFLASPESAYITGAEISVEGGYGA